MRFDWDQGLTRFTFSNFIRRMNRNNISAMLKVDLLNKFQLKKRRNFPIHRSISIVSCSKLIIINQWVGEIIQLQTLIAPAPSPFWNAKFLSIQNAFNIQYILPSTSNISLELIYVRFIQLKFALKISSRSRGVNDQFSYNITW